MKRLFLLVSALVILGGLVVTPAPVGAKGEQSFICFTNGVASGGGNGGNGDGKDYAGNDIFTPAQLEALNANRPFYEKAAGKVGIPWEMIATVHYRETRFARANPDNGQGIYQYPSGNGGPYPAGAVSEEEFQRQTDFTAEFILGKAGEEAEGLKNGDHGAVKYTFFGYNGRAGVYIDQGISLGFSAEEAANGEGSPYVMNRFDAKRDPTVEPTKSNGTWGQIKRDYGSIEYPANGDAGAYTIFAAIAGAGSGPCSGGGNGDITDTAIRFSWPPGDKNVGSYNPKSEYVEGMKKANLNGAYGSCTSLRSDGNSDGASCDVFVATVMRNTVDESFPCCGTNSMLAMMLSDPKFKEHYDLVVDGSQRAATTADLKSGDIMILEGHIMMYVELEDGTGRIASASCGDRTADHAGGVYFSDSRGNYYVFRWKG